MPGHQLTPWEVALPLCAVGLIAIGSYIEKIKPYAAATLPRIEVSGSHEVRRAPELYDVYVRFSHESKQAGESMKLVSEATHSLAAQVRDLAPAKAETEPRLNLDVSDATDIPEEYPPAQPEKPITSWSLQQVHTWSFERTPPQYPGPGDDKEQYGKFFVAEASAKITFHDFDELSTFVTAVSVSHQVLTLQLADGLS